MSTWVGGYPRLPQMGAGPTGGTDCVSGWLACVRGWGWLLFYEVAWPFCAARMCACWSERVILLCAELDGMTESWMAMRG